ncbi:unnamed protein product [Lota lota]
MSVSSEGSIPPAEDDFESPIDELLGSQSRRWLSDCFAGQPSDPNGNINTVGQDGLFVDYNFPIGQSLLSKSIEWKRPMELCKLSPPQFIVDGATRMDVCQGNLGDCWFLSALASLSMHPSLLERVVPPGQSFQNGYDGSFYFRFWQYGKWEEVRVDDLLPTKNGQLFYLRSPVQNEFWSCLLEKAYAKLKGGYQALELGFPHEAMADMTGGVTEVLTVASFSKNLARSLQYLLDKGALINCANCQGPLEQKNEQGILFRHAYSLTAVEKVETSTGPVTLVRLHNPWGGTEWEGPWSDLKGPEWNTVSKDEQRRLGRVNKEDGEFWMSVSDFCKNLEVIELCHMSDTLSKPGTTSRPWHCQMHQGNWVPNVSAGGPINLGYFYQNPQFFLTLLEEDDDPADPEKTCSFLVALMQKTLRSSGLHLSIGIDVYQARSPGTPLSPQDLIGFPPLLSMPHVMRREVMLRGALAPGHYVIIPYTALPNQEGAFILRVLTEKGNDVTPADMPETINISTFKESPFPHLKALPSPNSTRQLFKKHCSKGICKPLDLYHLLKEAIEGGVLAGSERHLVLEHCKSMVVLMDSQGLALLDWSGFKTLWYKIQIWTDVFLRHDKNGSKQLEYVEVESALKSAGIHADSFVMQFVGMRYTEPDMTISYPGFLFLMMKLESMIQKFHAYDMAGRGTISISFREWLHLTMFN